MKSRDKFFAEEDYKDSAKKKPNKFHNSFQMTDRLGNPIRLGDLTQVTLKDGTFLNECEVIDIQNGMVTVIGDEFNDSGEFIEHDVPANSVVVISI
jgi:hypothetical protein